MTEVFICGSKRTPVGRYGGVLASVRPDDLAAHVITALLADRALPVDEVIFGCANQAGEDNRNVARMAVLLSSLPETVPAVTVNRLCASGLDAIIAGARAIALGDAHLVIAGGVESMTRAPLVMPKADSAFSRQTQIFDSTIGWRFVHDQIARRFGIESMPETAENVAAEFGIARVDQDAYAYRSQMRYDAAWHAADIAPIIARQPKKDPVTVAQDEHPRVTTREKLAQLPTPFRPNGTVTAGNASGVNDGAAVVLLASAQAVRDHGLRPLARIGKSRAVGVAPRIMGVGPIGAVDRLCADLGLSPTDFGVIELNEAFAAQVLACTRAWGLADDASHVNAHGGGISIGHPLGMSGARITAAAARRLAETGAQHALVTMCVGVGQGVALALHAP